MQTHTTRYFLFVTFILKYNGLKVLKKDSRRKSFAEAMFDIVVGFLIYLPVNFFVLPYFTSGIDEYNVATMLSISVIYSSIAIARKYLIRRWFVSKNLTETLQKLTKFIK